MHAQDLGLIKSSANQALRALALLPAPCASSAPCSLRSLQLPEVAALTSLTLKPSRVWESSHGTSSHLRLSPWRHYVSLFSRCCWSLPSRPATSCGHGTDQATRHSTSASSSQTASGCSSLNRRLPTLASPRISLALPVYVHMHTCTSMSLSHLPPPSHLPTPYASPAAMDGKAASGCGSCLLHHPRRRVRKLNGN